MSNTKSPVDVLITVPFSPSLIAPLQDVSPLLRITVHPAQNIKDVPDELWARCEVLYTDRIIPEPDLAPKLKWVQHHHAGINSSMEFLSKDRPNLTVTTSKWRSSFANSRTRADHAAGIYAATTCPFGAAEKGRMAKRPLGTLQAARITQQHGRDCWLWQHRAAGCPPAAGVRCNCARHKKRCHATY